MGVINNLVLTKFKSEGAEEASKGMTRLGNASAATGRQFAAQAQGMGSFVAAYAGAAASIFALQQAYSALLNAAKVEQLINSTKILAAVIGESGTSMLKSFQDIAKGQLTLSESASSLNIALSAGFNKGQIEDLEKGAVKASIALGRDMTDAMNRIFRGVTKLEPELLDELGIFTRIEPAARAYAATLGKGVGDLTNFEKRQAFLVTVTKELETKFGNIDTSATTALQSLTKLGITILEIGTNIGIVLVNAIKPLADFITNNLAVSLALFGALTQTVFGKAISLAEIGFLKLGNATKAYTDRLVDFSSTKNPQAIASLNALATSTESINKSMLKGDSKKYVKQLLELASSGKASKSELESLNKELIKQELAAKNTIVSLNETIERREKAGKNIEKEKNSLARQEAQIIAYTDAQKKAANASSSMGVISTGLSRVFSAAGTAVSFVVGGLLRLAGIIGVVITAISILTPAVVWLSDKLGFTDPIIKFGLAIKDITLELLGLDEKSKNLKIGENIEKSMKLNLKDKISISPQTVLTTSYENPEMPVFSEQVVDPLADERIKEIKTTIGAISSQLGITAEQFDKTFKVDVINGSSIALKSSNEELGSMVLYLEGADLSQEKLNEHTITYSRLINNATNNAKDLAKGIISGEEASKRLAVLKEDEKKLGNRVSTQAKDRLADQKVLLQDEVDMYNIGKKMEKVLGNEIAAGEKQLGILNEQGELAESELEIRQNQLKYFEKNLYMLENMTLSGERSKETQDLITKSLNAGKGIMEKLTKESFAMRLEIEKANAEITNKEAEITLTSQLNIRKELINQLNIELERTKVINDYKIKNIELDYARAQSLREVSKINEEIALREREALKKHELDTKKEGLFGSFVSPEQIAQNKVEIISIQLEQVANDLKNTLQKISDETIKQDAILRAQIEQLDNERNIKLQVQEAEKANLITEQALANNKFDLEKTNLALGFKLEELRFKTLQKEQEFLIKVIEKLGGPEAAKDLKPVDLESEMIVLRSMNEQRIGLVDTEKKESDKLFSSKVNNMKRNGDLETLKYTNEKKHLEQSIIDNKIKAENDSAIAKATADEKTRALLREQELEKMRADYNLQTGRMLIDGVAEAFGSSFKEMITTVQNGTATIGQAFKKMLYNILLSISDTINQRLLINPLKEALGSGLEGLWNKIGSGAATAGATAALSNISFSSVDPFYNFDLSDFSAGFMNGGRVRHMASGGTMLRDRVSAMLEPGEFVMNKTATSRVGAANLQRMNTGGSTTPQVQVNLNNEGTPQEAKGQPKISMDGEKMIIDVILRDYNNNGPIRQTLRGAQVK